jgi:predicted ATPase
VAFPEGTVTFLFTDVEGSTRRLECAPDEYREALEASRKAIRTACRLGHEVDTQGDAFFFAFARADEAVAAAQSAQERLVDSTLRVRMGIHTGDVRRGAEGYVGLEVNRAARIAAAAHGGQVLISQATRDLVPTADAVDLGEHRLRDLSVPMRLFQLGHELFPPPLTLENRPTNLPAQPWPLVGRERELAELRALMLEGAGRPLTVTGPAGAGKTRLALQVAAEAVDDFPGGVWYVALDAVRDPERVVPTVATTLGIAEAELEREIGARRPLLVLDNLEQVLAAAPAVAALARLRGATVLVTSRAPLKVAGEQEYPLGPLEVEAAVELFVERAHAVRPDFASQNGTLAELVERLDGLPLAIELAAARVRLLSPETILSRLDDRFTLLTGGPRDSPERQRTLASAIDWSYDLLTEDEQELLAKLSCFVGGFDLEAAEAVCGATLDRLEALVENSLLRVDEGRFSLLDAIREYASQRLYALGQQNEAALRHAGYYAALGEQARAETRDGFWLEKWMSWGSRETGNLRAAIATLEAAGETEDATRTTLALVAYLHSHGVLLESEELLGRLVPHLDELDTGLRADVDQERVSVLWLRGDVAGCREISQDLLERARAQGDATHEAAALNGLGLAALRDGDYEQADRWFARYEHLAQEKIPRLLSTAINNRSALALIRGESATARRMLEDALALDSGWGVLEHNIALSHLAENHEPEALGWFAKSIAKAQSSQHDGTLVYGLHGLASLYRESDPRLAARLRGCGLALAQRLGIDIEEPDAGVARATDSALAASLGDEYDDLLAEGAYLVPADVIRVALAPLESETLVGT